MQIVQGYRPTITEANWNPEIAPGWTLNLHAGRQIVKNFAAYNYWPCSSSFFSGLSVLQGGFSSVASRGFRVLVPVICGTDEAA